MNNECQYFPTPFPPIVPKQVNPRSNSVSFEEKRQERNKKDSDKCQARYKNTPGNLSSRQQLQTRKKKLH